MISPILSVVVPSFNQGQFICENILECLRYKPAGVELLVLDGGSTDSTLRRIQPYLGDIDFFRTHKDGGQAQAISEGFRRARGEWIAFQNSDDYYLPDALGQVLSVCESNSEIDLIIGGVAFVDVAGNTFAKHYPKPILKLAMASRNYINNQALFVRRRLFEAAGNLDVNLQYCLDYDWFVRLLNESPKIKYMPSLVGAQRFHADTKTSRIPEVQREEFKVVTRRHFGMTQRIASHIADPMYRLYRLGYGMKLSLQHGSAR